MSNGNMPEKKFKAGSISATVWKNKIKKKDGGDAEVVSVTMQRSYKDKGGTWQNTGSMRVMDLPKAILVIKKAFEHLVMKGDNDGEVEGENSPTSAPEVKNYKMSFSGVDLRQGGVA